MKFWAIFGGVVAVIAILVMVAIGSSNRIPRLDESVKAAWAEVENQYQQRGDKILNLVETVKGAGDQETRTLVGVIHERASATKMEVPKSVITDPAAMERLEAQQGQLGAAMGRLMVSVEKYPELKTNANFQALQKELSETERAIAAARRRYIAISQVFNTTIRTIPGRWWNEWFYDLKPVEPLKADPGTRERPTVNFRGKNDQ